MLSPSSKMYVYKLDSDVVKCVKDLTALLFYHPKGFVVVVDDCHQDCVTVKSQYRATTTLDKYDCYKSGTLTCPALYYQFMVARVFREVIFLTCQEKARSVNSFGLWGAKACATEEQLDKDRRWCRSRTYFRYPSCKQDWKTLATLQQCNVLVAEDGDFTVIARFSQLRKQIWLPK